MEYLDGQPLDAYLLDEGKLPALEVCELLQDVCAPAARGASARSRSPRPQAPEHLPGEAGIALKSFRVRITVVSSPPDRIELMKDFVTWEKKYCR